MASALKLKAVQDTNMDDARKALESLCIRYSAKAGEAGVTASVGGVEELIQDFALSLSD